MTNILVVNNWSWSRYSQFTIHNREILLVPGSAGSSTRSPRRPLSGRPFSSSLQIWNIPQYILENSTIYTGKTPAHILEYSSIYIIENSTLYLGCDIILYLIKIKINQFKLKQNETQYYFNIFFYINELIVR